MPMPWFRLYTEARHDPKLRRLSDAQFRVWFNLLCLAAEQSDRGDVTGFDLSLLADDIAGGDCNALMETCNALQRLRVVTFQHDGVEGEYTIAFLNFEKRQTHKPSDSPDRVRDRVAKCRENKRSGDAQGDVTPPVTPCNAPVTPPVTPVTPCNALDETRIEEKRTDTPLYPPSPGGDGVCVAETATEDREPFDPTDGKPLAEPQAYPPSKVGNTAEDIARLAKLAEDLFPLSGFPSLVRSTAVDTEAEFIELGLQAAHAKGKTHWGYVRGTIQSAKADAAKNGGAVPRPRAGRHPPAEPSPSYYAPAVIPQRGRKRSTTE